MKTLKTFDNINETDNYDTFINLLKEGKLTNRHVDDLTWFKMTLVKKVYKDGITYKHKFQHTFTLDENSKLCLALNHIIVAKFINKKWEWNGITPMDDNFEQKETDRMKLSGGGVLITTGGNIY